MNPKVTIAVDAKNRAIVSLTGIVSVGAKVDVEISGLPNDIPDWTESDKFSGKSLRLRIVDCDGRDIVRYPLVEKTTEPASSGDTWTVSQTGNVYTTSSGCFVECDTDGMRRAFCGVRFDDSRDFGLVLDSVVDSAEYAVGKIKVRQWSAASTDDPTVLPDWRETLDELNTRLGQVDSSVATAQAAATSAATSSESASSSASAASSSANAALISQNAAGASAVTASSKATEASNSASSAASSALSAASQVAKYPKIDATTKHWIVYDSVTAHDFVDTGVVAEGQDGTSPHVGQNGHWYVGETDTGVSSQGPKGDTGSTGATGAPGPANTLSIGTVTGGQSASATITGGSPYQTLNLVLPKGDKGDDGDDGKDGESPHVGQNGNWYVGTTDTGVRAQGPAGTTSWIGITDKPDSFVPSAHRNSHKIGCADAIYPSDIGAISSSAKGSAGGVAELDANGKVPAAQLPYSGDMKHSEFSSLDPDNSSLADVIIILKGLTNV